MVPSELSAALKEKARALGAELSGIAPAAPPPESAAYLDWLSSGFEGTMNYMARDPEKRRDITLWYREAKSVLVCGFAYADNAPRPARKGSGRVSRYAALEDYHRELKNRMRAILEWLQGKEPSTDGLVFVDTSPVLERAYARYAGLGWIGKNTMLLSQKTGSYFFLAGLALNLELPPDEPVQDHCGRCNRCLSSCPTDAFSRERVLDSRRCISYLTIEHRGPIPEELRSGMGDWIMGCDICQEVCPFNKFSIKGPVLKPALEEALPLEETTALSEEDFRRRFGKTALSRPKRKGILRNVLTAMGNSGDTNHRATLERFAEDPDPGIREHARWSLRKLSSKTQVDKLPPR